MFKESSTRLFHSDDPRAQFSIARWDGSVTVTDPSGSVAIKAHREALDSAIKSHLRSLRYVGQEDAVQQAADIRGLIEILTETYSYLENRFPNEVNKAINA